jgi:hypothetical protein
MNYTVLWVQHIFRSKLVRELAVDFFSYHQPLDIQAYCDRRVQITYNQTEKFIDKYNQMWDVFLSSFAPLDDNHDIFF